MSFGTPIFLFLFLPISVIGYFLMNSKLKNIFLLLASIIFYTCGSIETLIIINISIVVNFFLGLTINKAESQSRKKIIFINGIIFNILLLVLFKYTSFLINNFFPFFPTINSNLIIFFNNYSIIGLSFFTFQSISYLTDTYLNKIKPEKNLINFALYISFFPKLIAGPITKYKEFQEKISSRITTIDDYLEGINRFIIGLGKKTIIGDTTGKIADNIFKLSSGDLTTPLAWLGLMCFTLQIYFDFSGYSDMAIGISKIFGFNLPENFNYPYVSKSIKEFWQRWHISLSTWLKDYLYIPLGGNRKGEYRTYLNSLIVFILSGFWHGASWNFILWGAWYGIFIAIEQTNFGKFMQSRTIFLQHVYTLLVIMIGWIFFKTTNITDGFHYLRVLLHFGNIDSNTSLNTYINSETIIILILGIVSSCPIYVKIKKYFETNNSLFIKTSLYSANVIFLSVVFLISVSIIATQTYIPFIYQQF